jgi:hypothetical protein
MMREMSQIHGFHNMASFGVKKTAEERYPLK